MCSPDTPERDLVDSLLTVEAPTRADGVRSRLMAQTLAVVRRRRTIRRLAVVAALTGCYLAGMATMQAVREIPTQPDGAVAEMSEAPKDGPSPGEPPRQREREMPTLSEEDAPAIAQSEFVTIRQAGDRHLHETGDVLAALDNYVQALDRATAEELAVSCEDDSFLLAALKLARIEEKRNEDDGT